MLVAILAFTVVFLICGAVAARALARMGRQLGRTGVELEHLGGRLDDRILPRAEAVMGQVEDALRDLEALGEQAKAVTRGFEDALAPIGDITVRAEAALRPLGLAAASVGVDGRRVRALGSGLAAFFGRLSGRLLHRRADPHA